MSREGPMLTKLKEGLQEAIVFLRQLGDFKIPAVMERRRKGLLDKLLDMQDDTFKGDSAPTAKNVIFGGTPEVEETTESAIKVEEEKEKEKEMEKDKSSEVNEVAFKRGSPSRVSPTKRLSRGDSRISALVGGYEQITSAAKKEEISQTPKRLVVLKKVAKPDDFPDKDEGMKEETAKDKEPEAEAEVEKEKEKAQAPNETTSTLATNDKDKKDDTTKRLSTASDESGAEEEEEQAEEGGEEAEESGKKKKKDKQKKEKKSKFKIGNFLKHHKGRDRDKSPAREALEPPDEEQNAASEAEDAEESTPPTEVEPEEGVVISGTLEKKMKGRFQSKWTKVALKLKDSVLHIGSKEKIELAGCMVETSDVGFDVSDTSNKQHHFKAEDEEEKLKWVEAINTAIKECTPEQEEPVTDQQTSNGIVDGDVPSIKVEPAAAADEEEPTTPAAADQDYENSTFKRKKESKGNSLTVKQQKKLPEAGVEMKGYLYRKKPGGIGSRWDKTYCVITYQAIYFTTMQDNAEYNHMLPIMGDFEKKLAEKKNGHNKNSKGIEIKVGKTKESLSIEGSEYTQWLDGLNKVLGIGGVEELLSEDEGDIAEDVGGEELYEELELDPIVPPPVPSSPRPTRTPLQVNNEPDDLMIDEDIYEDTDEYRPDSLMAEPSPVHVAPPPALPDRNPAKQEASPPPSLPPRNAGPSLPPRGSGVPQKPEAPPSSKPPAKLPPPEPDEGGEEVYDDVIPAKDEVEEIEETYDDVIVGGETEEMYEDVIVGGDSGEIEETYDDVVSATTSHTNGPSEKGTTKISEPEPITEEYYEDMAPGTSSEGPQEDYVVMEHTEDVGGEELYVDVDTPTDVTTTLPKISAPVEDQNSSSKTMKAFSRMFNKKPTSPQLGRKVHSGLIHYKPPKKGKFEEKWAVIEGNLLLIYKHSSAKNTQEKLPLSECGLDPGSPEAGTGDHAFRITKGDKVHHFLLKSKMDYDKWVEILAGLTKYASVNFAPPVQQQGSEQEIYQAKEDHIGETDDQLTFKKGAYIKLISNVDGSGGWPVGQLGNESQVFEGKIGKFPMNKVEQAEDLYI